MIQTLLSYGADAKTSQLTSQLWLKDTSGHYDDADVENGLNLNLYKRSAYFHNSKSCDMEGVVYHDLCNLDKYIMNSVAINFKLYRSRPEFCLLTSESNPDFELILEDICLKVAKLSILSSVITAHANRFQTTNAKYQFTRTEVRMISMPGGTMSFNYNDLFNSITSIRACIGLVDAESAAGSYTLNPFNFQHFNLNQIALKLNGVPVSGNVMQLFFKNPCNNSWSSP